jgi:hypothetical protein
LPVSLLPATIWHGADPEKQVETKEPEKTKEPEIIYRADDRS